MTVRREVACRSYLPSRESVGVFSCKKIIVLLQMQHKKLIGYRMIRMLSIPGGFTPQFRRLETGVPEIGNRRSDVKETALPF